MLDNRTTALETQRSIGLHDVPGIGEVIYQRFFVSGIIVILTVGAVWGAYLLWQIGLVGSYTGISIYQVNAHGHAQIFGWVGLFIMGFAYQVFPQFWQTKLAYPRLREWVFVMMVVGLVFCTFAMPIPDVVGSSEIVLVGGIITCIAAMLFAGQLFVTFQRSGGAFDPWVGFVLIALVWFVLQSIMSTWHTWNLMTAIGREQLLWYLATYQAPLRDLQIHGLALFMILGVSMRLLPGLIGTYQTPRQNGWIGLTILTLAVVSEVALFIAYRYSENHQLAAFLLIPWLMLAVGIGVVVLPWRLWRKPTNVDRSTKFIRTAYLWLAISLAMLLLLPVHHLLSGLPFSHAYYGAIRHAITVGFVSLMIMGTAAKLVPTVHGVDTRSLSSLWGPFILINLGCLLRVSLQVATDWVDVAFLLVGISGVLEVAGLAWWSIHLVGIMVAGKRSASSNEASAIPERIAAYHFAGDVVCWYPKTLEVFTNMGIGPVCNPILRRTIARRVTLAQLCAISRISLEVLLNNLNTKIDAPAITEIQPCSKQCESCCCANATGDAHAQHATAGVQV